MADRKPFLTVAPVNEELEEILRNTRHRVVTEEELREQRISFAYGNAFSDNITKESVRRAAENMRLLPQ